MAEQLFSLTHNERFIEPNFTVIERGLLRGEMKPMRDWQPAERAASATLHVFTTPIEGYVDIEAELDQKEGQVVKLGEIATWSHFGDLVELNAEPGNMYDVFCVAKRADGTGAMYGGGRFAVTDDPSYEVPYSVTFDEAKFFGYVALGLTNEQAKEIDVTVAPMTAWGDTLPGRLIIAGLELGSTSDETFAPGITVDHFGRVNFYHGRNAVETLEAAGLPR